MPNRHSFFFYFFCQKPTLKWRFMKAVAIRGASFFNFTFALADSWFTVLSTCDETLSVRYRFSSMGLITLTESSVLWKILHVFTLSKGEAQLKKSISLEWWFGLCQANSLLPLVQSQFRANKFFAGCLKIKVVTTLKWVTTLLNKVNGQNTVANICISCSLYSELRCSTAAINHYDSCYVLIYCL